MRPLLTPDNYRQYAVELIKSARTELLLQNQTFNAATADQKALREILDAVLDRQKAGVKVRIIFRVLFPPKARQNVEELRDYGFNTDSIKVQKNCHTKGIVVDGKHVMIGSQNISDYGVSVNRDASLIFYDDPELADVGVLGRLQGAGDRRGGRQTHHETPAQDNFH